jgi:hypothetical protein
MSRNILFIFVLLLPLLAYAAPAGAINHYLLGKWRVESIKEQGDSSYHPPHHPVKWEFTRNGDLIEELGKTGAKIHWHYRVVGRDIKVQLGRMRFSWRIISMKDKKMVIRHQLGLFKVERM